MVLACGDSGPPAGEDQGLQGSWSVVYEPPRPVIWPGPCQRSIPYAIMAMGNDGGFELSVNTYDDCRSSGGEFTSGEVLHFGSYIRQGNLVTITLDHLAALPLTGTVEGDYIRLTLPPQVGVSSAELELLMGPIQPF